MAGWKADLGDGTYRNPVVYADYSDPDILKDGDDYYMVASSFAFIPGVPVLHSKDLVNWRIINYCVREIPFARYDQPAHGCGTWAPAIRLHNGIFYVFIPMPDEGIFVTTTKDPYGEWSPLHCIKKTSGWIDPCPFWDEDGKAYMVHAFANSRCGIKHKLNLCRMAEDATHLLDDGVIVFDGELSNPTTEGPKLYKRNGYYYIFAPAGGVKPGWQLILRSKDIYGPYETKIVLHQGNTDINGPHQGGYVEGQDGRFAFLHFQDVGAFGRILHLQPMCWQADWPFIGLEQNGDGIGEPVTTWKKMAINQESEQYAIATDDEFDTAVLGLQWQWQGNPKPEWYAVKPEISCLRLQVMNNLVRDQNLIWYAPYILTQIPQSPCFEAITTVDLCKKQSGDMAGIGMLGFEYSFFGIAATSNGNEICLRGGLVTSKDAVGTAQEKVLEAVAFSGTKAHLKMIVKDGFVSYTYSTDGKEFTLIGIPMLITEGAWTGAKVFLAAVNTENKKSEGYCDFDYIRFTV